MSKIEYCEGEGEDNEIYSRNYDNVREIPIPNNSSANLPNFRDAQEISKVIRAFTQNSDDS